MIKVSETAKQKVIALMTEEGFDASKDFVRVGVKSGGCSGLSYELNFDQQKADEADKVLKTMRFASLSIKRAFCIWLAPHLEYSGGLNGKGFVFNNPNAQRTCGCGESFSL